ncbi:hypothetical protein ACJWDR_28995 [Streptomyces tauricus]|uniref:hypothetical protein n=1 Tax=Streptomyces tauricus TaxID=68274 RepID=UPI00387EEAFB
MAKSQFSWNSESDPNTPVKENLDVLRGYGLSASATHKGDGTVDYRISGDAETVAEWKRLISG